MPKRSDIKKVLVIGSGPIVIGQACEFDYSGSQAIRALKEEGVEVVLLNSNPATVMTDPDFADKTYVEPITPEVAEQIIAMERPDSLLATMGGQTALNMAKALAERGTLERYDVKLIGVSLDAIEKSEDRQKFKDCMEHIGLSLPRSGLATSVEEAKVLSKDMGFPLVIRPSFTLGGTGGGIAYDENDLVNQVTIGLDASPVRSVLVEESVLGWKELEFEVIRDAKDNVIVVCSIENLDPMGVHTGDSITVAPIQTLTKTEYQKAQDAAIAVVREVGVASSGSNVQLAMAPSDERMVVIEVNPRVSRSSALASKATGFPIARIATKLALGYTLDEIRSPMVAELTACFEPTIDYVAVKLPRFNFEKFSGASNVLGTAMRSVGEVMALGRNFREAYMKAMRSLELGRHPLSLPEEGSKRPMNEQKRLLSVPTPERPWVISEAFWAGASVESVARATQIDVWFLTQIQQLVEEARSIRNVGQLESLSEAQLRTAKSHGFSDAYLAALLGTFEGKVRSHRRALGIRPVYKRVDCCAGEFESLHSYLYSTYAEENESEPSARPKVVILGSGPIRIGQGIEFDYCCVHAVFALRKAGFEAVMVNCNPETVSTDHEISDRLYFESLSLEDVLEVVDHEKPLGVIVQLGGQTPLQLSWALEKEGVRILGTAPDDIDRAEDRERFVKVVEKLKLRQPENGVARSEQEAYSVATLLGFPLILRPSYVLGGRAMQVVRDGEDLARCMNEAISTSPQHPVLLDRFLNEAVEVDVDVVADKEGNVLVGGVLEHVEEAGVHSGDAACTLPPHSLSTEMVERLKDVVTDLARELRIIGLLNVQFAVQGKSIYVLEANPRASRTIPFVSKATGVSLAQLAARCMLGELLPDMGFGTELPLSYIAVKEAVFPFARFSNTDILLGPEMRSTGEVMGLSDNVEVAFGKSQLAAGTALPRGGKAFLSVKDDDKPGIVDVARRLGVLGFEVLTTRGTQSYLAKKGIASQSVNKVAQGKPSIVDLIRANEVALIINTTDNKKTISDSYAIRHEALLKQVPAFTTLEAARMLVGALEAQARKPYACRPLQSYLSGK
ncbi:MAG: carbamoyl-phosphate synthase large subunit [Proteobacteria bacterium]|nr:carbamoyl-phosphate synthase large subunit [Cystobacterineae bacterium]MCL2259310.1 carbamoyl-phosphate synthase large subunit [Cystobacterineae bacterium]MCL2314259.1 carbamoyl-phosphate synthase large subunit [Pseudomonadota bacterium]